MVKAILWLTIPTLAGNAVQNVIGVIIMYFVSRLGTEAIAAVSVAGTVLMLLFTAIIGLSVGTTALVARFHGARDEKNLERAMVTTLTFSAGVALVTAAAGIWAGKPLLQLFGAEPAVIDLSYSYIRVFFLGDAGLILLMMITAILRGLGDSVTPTLLVALAVVLDVFLEPLFIFGWGPVPRLEVPGAALGGVLAYTLATVAAIVILRRRHLSKRAFTWANVDKKLTGQLFSIGVPASAQMLIRVLAQMVLVGFVARTGTAAMAAFGIGNQLTSLTLIPCFAFAMSAAVLTGQNLGAGNAARAERSALASVGFAAGVAAVIVVGLVAFAPVWVRRFDDKPEVITLGVQYLYICAPSYLFVPLGMVLSRAMGGAGVSVPPLFVTAAVLLGIRIPLAFLLVNVLEWGPVGVYWAVAVPSVLEGVLMFWIFKSGVWKRKKL